MRRFACHDALKSVTRSFRAATQAVAALILIAKRHPELLPGDAPSASDLRSLLDELEDAYLVKLFAAFEGVLRQYWNAQGRPTTPPTHALLTGIAARRRIPQDVVDWVHDIRGFRNKLVHEEHAAVEPISVSEASRWLHEFLARLPEEW